MLTERLKRMTEQALPVRVRIHFVVIDDGYYIHFDGSEAANIDPVFWSKFWKSFDGWCKFTLMVNGFPTFKLVETSDTYVVAFVGTLFDFLKAEHE